jgi:uncharacterized membrane protein (DUF2068 family)
MASSSPRSLGLFLIGIFKLSKGILFTAIGIGMLKLIDKDIDDLFRDLIAKLHIDAEHKFIQNIILQLSHVTNHTLEELSIFTFLFAFLLYIEAFGLLWQKVWAEFVTIAETSLFIPFEIYEIFRHATIIKVSILAINVAIVGYLVWAIMRKTSGQSAAALPAK